MYWDVIPDIDMCTFKYTFFPTSHHDMSLWQSILCSSNGIGFGGSMWEGIPNVYQFLMIMCSDHSHDWIKFYIVFSHYVNYMIEHIMLFIINSVQSVNIRFTFSVFWGWYFYRLLFQFIYGYYFRDDDVINVMIELHSSSFSSVFWAWLPCL